VAYKGCYFKLEDGRWAAQNGRSRRRFWPSICHAFPPLPRALMSTHRQAPIVDPPKPHLSAAQYTYERTVLEASQCQHPIPFAAVSETLLKWPLLEVLL
jgi:hypothetical protein